MLTVRKLSYAQASTYYSKDNYYTQQVGEYYGKLKSELGLNDLTHDSFQNLLNGVNPTTGERLVNNKNNKEGAVPALDFTFSPSKSISIVYELAVQRGDTELANRILQAHDSAVNQALSHIEEEHIKTRYQENKIKYNPHTHNFIAAKFQHDINRELEPQLHTHSVVFNFTKTKDGKYRAIDASNLLKKNSPIVKNLGQYYRNILKDELEKQGFDLRIKDKKQCFYELSQIEDNLIKAFSKRSTKIKEKVKELEKKFPNLDKSQLNLKAFFKTRDAKKDVNRDDVRSKNIELMSQYIDIDKLHKGLSNSHENSTIKVDTKEVQKIIKNVRAELTKWQRTPLNIATKTLALLPSNSDTKIQTLYKEIKTQEVKYQKKLNTMHEVVIHSLQAGKLDTEKLFKNLNSFKQTPKINIEEVIENGRPGSDRVRAYAVARELARAEQTNDRDAISVDRETITRGDDRREPGVELERHDDDSNRVARKSKPVIITKADIDIAERGYKKYLKNQNKGIEK